MGFKGFEERDIFEIQQKIKLIRANVLDLIEEMASDQEIVVSDGEMSGGSEDDNPDKDLLNDIETEYGKEKITGMF